MDYCGTHNLSGLEDGRQGDTDDEDQGHGPVHGGMVEGVKLLSEAMAAVTYDGEENQAGGSDNDEKDGEPVCHEPMFEGATCQRFFLWVVDRWAIGQCVATTVRRRGTG